MVNILTIGRFGLHCGVVFTFIYLLMYIFKSVMTFLFIMIVTGLASVTQLIPEAGQRKRAFAHSHKQVIFNTNTLIIGQVPALHLLTLNA